MSFETVIFILCALPAALPLLIAALARRSSIGVRVALAVAGVIAAIFAVTKHSAIRKAAAGGGDFKGAAILLLPISTAIIAFYVAFCGVAAATVITSIAVGRPFAPISIFAALLFAASVGLGIIYGNAFLSWSH